MAFNLTLPPNHTYWAEVPCTEMWPYKCSGTRPGECGGLSDPSCSDGSDSLPAASSVEECGTFVCTVKGVNTCLDQRSVSDTTPQCDNARDEKQPNRTDCKSEYKRKGLIPVGAESLPLLPKCDNLVHSL